MKYIELIDRRDGKPISVFIAVSTIIKFRPSYGYERFKTTIDTNNNCEYWSNDTVHELASRINGKPTKTNPSKISSRFDILDL